MNKIKNFLRKWTWGYTFFQKLWHGFREILEKHILGTKLQQLIWRTKHLYKGKRWAEDYQKSTDHPHRKQIVEAVSLFDPFESVLEIGCNSGPNLILLYEKFPNARFVGIDINKAAIDQGKRYVTEKKINNIEFFVKRAHKLNNLENKSIDVAFTDAVLLLIAKDQITNVLQEMERISRKGFILNEYHSPSLANGNYEKGRWVYNYVKLINQLFPSARVNVTKSAFTGGDWDKYGALVQVWL